MAMTKEKAIEILTSEACGDCGLTYGTCEGCTIKEALETITNTEKTLECVGSSLRKKPMILFSDRLLLARFCQEWLEKNEVKAVPESVIAFLVNQELIDEAKFEKWKEEHNA